MLYSEIKRGLRTGSLTVATGPCEIGRCASGSANLVYDHCHRHGHVRGVLCNSCNSVMKRIDSIMTDDIRLNVATIRKLTLRLHIPTLPSSYLRHWDKCPECTLMFTGDDVLKVLDFHLADTRRAGEIYYGKSLVEVIKARRRYRRMYRGA